MSITGLPCGRRSTLFVCACKACWRGAVGKAIFHRRGACLWRSAFAVHHGPRASRPRPEEGPSSPRGVMPSVMIRASPSRICAMAWSSSRACSTTPRRSQKLSKTAGQLQDILGHHNDAVGVDDLVRRRAARGPEAVHAAGYLIGCSFTKSGLNDMQLQHAWRYFRTHPRFWRSDRPGLRIILTP